MYVVQVDMAAQSSSLLCDSLVFDVACSREAVDDESTADAACIAYASERGVSVDEVRSQLAAFAVLNFTRGHTARSSVRQNVYRLTRRHAPGELLDLPFKLEGASSTQLLDVLSLLEQTFGDVADAEASSDCYGELLQHNAVLSRENAELRRQLSGTTVAEGVRETLAAYGELVEHLNDSIALVGAVATRAADECSDLAARDAQTQCTLVADVDNDTRRKLSDAERELETLRARGLALERELHSTVVAMNERLRQSEQHTADVMRKAVPSRAPQRHVGTVTDAVPTPLERKTNAAVQVGIPPPSLDDAAWKAERARLVEKLAMATRLLQRQRA